MRKWGIRIGINGYKTEHTGKYYFRLKVHWLQKCDWFERKIIFARVGQNNIWRSPKADPDKHFEGTSVVCPTKPASFQEIYKYIELLKVTDLFLEVSFRLTLIILTSTIKGKFQNSFSLSLMHSHCGGFFEYFIITQTQLEKRLLRQILCNRIPSRSHLGEKL